jgi:predicted dehydrogenase
MARLTRRGFVKTAAAGGVVAPYVVHASVVGAGGQAAPSDRIGMGFIGLGGQGSGHLFGGAWTYLTGGYLARDDVQVLGVSDVWQNKREAACTRVNDYYAAKTGRGSHQACQAYGDFRHLLARPDVDAVLIATPNHWHAPMTILAFEAGKDVYCEKPTAVTVGESLEAVRAARRYGRIFQAGSQQRSEYDGKFRTACEYVRSGRIGRLLAVYAVRGFISFHWAGQFGPSKPVPPGFDWDLWLGPAPWVPYGRGGGTFMYGGNWEQHHYDVAQWGMGADRTGPVEVSPGELKYAGSVTVYPAQHPGERIGESGGCTFVGSDGRIAVDRERLASYPPEVLKAPLGPGDVRLYRSTSHSGNFLECVRTRRRPISDVETAHRAVSTYLLGGIAQRLGRTLKWDSEKGTFSGDDEANRLLSYARRPLPPLRQEA